MFYFLRLGRLFDHRLARSRKGYFSLVAIFALVLSLKTLFQACRSHHRKFELQKTAESVETRNVSDYVVQSTCTVQITIIIKIKNNNNIKKGKKIMMLAFWVSAFTLPSRFTTIIQTKHFSFLYSAVLTTFGTTRRWSLRHNNVHWKSSRTTVITRISIKIEERWLAEHRDIRLSQGLLCLTNRLRSMLGIAPMAIESPTGMRINNVGLNLAWGISRTVGIRPGREHATVLVW